MGCYCGFSGQKRNALHREGSSITVTGTASRKSLLFVTLSFVVFGAMFGVWQVLLADLQAALGLSAGTLGVALTAGTVASLPAMVFSGRAADRFGPRGLVVGTAVGLAAGLVATAAAEGFAALLVALFVLYGSSGAFDVGINTAAIEVERGHVGSLLPYFHAAYSGSAAVGAVAAGLALGAGVRFRPLYLATAVVLVGFALAVAVARALPHDGTGASGSGEKKNLFRHRLVLLVAVVALFAMFSEGTLENWSAIYLRRSLSLPADLGAAGVASFHAAMLVGRLAAGRAVDVVGRRRLLQGAGALGALGMTTALATTRPVFVVVGFGVVGLAMSVVVPLAFSLAGEFAPERSGEASSVVTFVGYGAFLAGPALVGGAAEVTSLRTALATVIVAGVGIVFLSWRLPSSAS